jgi:hypothetical protein
MKKNMLWIALAALILPILARGLWFYRGIPHQPKITTPDYQALTISQPPLETPVTDEKIKQTSGVVLFDFAHINQYQTPEVQSLEEAIAKRGGLVESITDFSMLEHKLKYASAYVVISPTMPFTEDELRLVKDFVERGGRLLVFTDATRSVVYYDYATGTTVNNSDASTVNPLILPYGITVNNDYLYNVNEHEGNFRNIFFDKFGKDELTFGLKRVAFYGVHSVKSSSGLTLLQGAESTLSSVDDAYDPAEGGAAISENGNVLAFGDFSFLTSPYKNVASNATLITNIADFTLGSKQTTTLAGFPYIFTQSIVQIYPTSKVELSAETIAAISELQKALRSANISAEVVDKAPRGGDALILGTFTASDDLLDFTDPFNIKLDTTDATGTTDKANTTDSTSKSTATETDTANETVTLKNFGKINRTGNGILLFEKNKKGNTLTLLANTPEDLQSLLTSLTSNSLSGCVLQGDIGVCSVGYSSSSSDETSSDTTYDATTTPEPVSGEATPEPTPTPAG